MDSMKKDREMVESLVKQLETYKAIQSICKNTVKLDNPQAIISYIQNTDMDDYSVIVAEGGRLCERMLHLLLEKHGYNVEYGLVIVNDGNQRRGCRPALSFCSRPLSFIPPECRRFIDFICKNRNMAAHARGISYETMVVFSKAFDYFLIWFKNNYIDQLDIDEKEKEQLLSRYYSFEFSLNRDVVLQTTETEAVGKIGELMTVIIQLQAQVQKIDERGERIEKKIDSIGKQLMELSKQIESYQNLVERQIKMAVSDEEIERIIAAFTDEYTDRIINNALSVKDDERYEIEKRKLIISLGEGAWNKMQPASQTFLISAKVIYDKLLNLDELIDYSGVCVLVTKALEREMNRRFYTDFMAYLDRTYHKDYSKYHTSLLFQGRYPLNPEKFTMGTIAFVLCYKVDKNTTEAQNENNQKVLLEYTKAHLISNLSKEEIEKALKEHACQIENIRDKYRNPSAHINELKRENAVKCFELVLDVERVLKLILDAYDY